MTAPDVSLASWFAKRAERTPSRRALTFEGRTCTYAELWQRVERLAAGLRAGGVDAGDRVGFLGLNQPAFFETLLAASRLDAIFVPLNFRLTAAELAYIIGDAGVHTLIVDEPHRAVIDAARDDVKVVQYVAADGQAAGWESYDALVDRPPVTGAVAVAEDDVAIIMYTSGTTGRPKGAMLKDMVITGGENVYPAEVESTLFAHPAVARVAVIGLPDERWGAAVTAIIVAKADPPTLEDLRAFAGRSLARYKLPTRLQIVDVVPRNPAGKVLKFELRERFAELAP